MESFTRRIDEDDVTPTSHVHNTDVTQDGSTRATTADQTNPTSSFPLPSQGGDPRSAGVAETQERQTQGAVDAEGESSRAAGVLEGFEEESRNTVALLNRAKVMLSNAEPLLETTEKRTPAFEPPEFVRRLNVFEEAELGASVTFECQYRGTPRPSCRWYLDDSEIPLGEGPDGLAEPEGRVVLDRSGEERDGTLRLVIRDARKADEGAYKCKAENQEGVASTTGYLSITGASIVPSPPAASPRPSDHAVSTPPLLGAISEQQSMEEREAAAYESEMTPLQQFIENVERGATRWPYAELDFLRTEEQRLAAAATAAAAAADVTTFTGGLPGGESKDYEATEEALFLNGQSQDGQSLDGWGSNMSVNTVRERPGKSSVEDLSDWVAVQNNSVEPNGFKTLPLNDTSSLDNKTPTTSISTPQLSSLPLETPPTDFGRMDFQSVSFGASDSSQIDQQGMNSNLDEAEMEAFSLSTAADNSTAPTGVILESSDVFTFDLSQQGCPAELPDENVAKDGMLPLSSTVENASRIAVPEPLNILFDVKAEKVDDSNVSVMSLQTDECLGCNTTPDEVLASTSRPEAIPEKSDVCPEIYLFDSTPSQPEVPALNKVLEPSKENRELLEDLNLVFKPVSSFANTSFANTNNQNLDDAMQSPTSAAKEEIKLFEDRTPSPVKTQHIPEFKRLTSIGSLIKDVQASAFLGLATERPHTTETSKPFSQNQNETEPQLPRHLEAILGKTRVEMDVFKTLDWFVEWTAYPWCFYFALVVLMTALASTLELSPALIILIVALVSAASFWFLIPATENGSEKCLSEK